MSFALPPRVWLVSRFAWLSWLGLSWLGLSWLGLSSVGPLGAQELHLRLAPRVIEVEGITPGASVTVVGVTREYDGQDFDRLRETLRDGDADGVVRVEFPRDLPLMIVAAIEDELGRAGVGTRGVGWAYDLGVLRDYGVDVFWLRPGRGDGWARVDRSDLFEDSSGGGTPSAALPEFVARDLVFAVDLTTLRSVLVKLPEDVGSPAPGYGSPPVSVAPSDGE